MNEEHFRQLAAVTEAHEVGAVRAAAGRLAEAVQEWKALPRWKADRDLGSARPFVAAVDQMVTELAGLGDDAELRAVVAVVMPPLGQFVSHQGAAAALEELRVVAMRRPRATADGRRFTGRTDRRDPEPPPRSEIIVRSDRDGQ